MSSSGSGNDASGAGGGGLGPLSPAVVSHLQAEAARHAAAHAPARLAQEANEHEQEEEEEGDDKSDEQMAQQELQEEPELVEAPLELEVADASSLAAEVDRVCALLSPVSASAWVLRVRTLKRISALCKGEEFVAVRRLPSFVAQMSRLRVPLCEQLGDRRSQVAKQACATISALSAHFKAAYLAPAAADAVDPPPAEQVAEARRVWLELSLLFIDALLPLIPITVQVIKASACLCLSALVKNIAALPQSSLPAPRFALIAHLATFGAPHKHGVVRDHAFRAIANCILRIPQEDLTDESEKDSEESKRIQAKLDAAAAAATAAETADASAAASSADATAPAAASSSSADAPASSSGSPLFSLLESTITAGIGDSFDKTRAAARLCLIHFRTVAPVRAARIIAAMTAPQQRVFEKQLADFLVNRSLGTAGSSVSASTAAAGKDATPPSSTSARFGVNHQIADEPEHNASDDEMEAELNPPAAAASAEKSAVATSTAAKKKAKGNAAASSSSGLRAARKKAAQLKKGAKKKSSGSGSSGDSSNSSSASSSAAASEDDGDFEVEVLEGKLKASSLGEKAQGKGKAASPASSNGQSAAQSEEEHEDDEEDSVSTAVATTGGDTASAHRARNFILLSKLLDLDNPCLTEKMIDFLMHDGVIDVFLSFISRVEPAASAGSARVLTTPEELAGVTTFADLGARYHNHREEGEEADAEKDAEAEEQPFQEWSDVPMRHRARPAADDAAEQTATRRSFHVMQILTAQRQSQSLLAALSAKVPAMVLRLMTVFHPSSRGNFYHACAVIQKLAEMFTGTVLTAICAPAGRTLVSLMLDHLHEPPVVPCLLTLVQLSIDNKVLGSAVPTDLVLKMRTMDALHEKLVARIVAHPCPSRLAAQGAADFLTLYVEKLLAQQQVKQGASMARLLEPIVEDGRGIEQLVAALVDRDARRPVWQLSCIGSLLHTLLSSVSESSLHVTDNDPQQQALMQMMGNAAGLVKELPNPLHSLKERMTRAIIAKFEPLCEELTRREEGEEAAFHDAAAASAAPSASDAVVSARHPPVRFSAYRVPVSFTSRRLHLLRLVARLVENDLQSSLREAESLMGFKRTQETIGGQHREGPSFDRAALEKPQAHRALRAVAQALTKPHLFNRVPSRSWEVLLGWFFLYVDNSFFLSTFKTLLVALIQYSIRAGYARDAQIKSATAAAAALPHSGGEIDSGIPSPTADDNLWRVLLVELRMVPRMIAFYHGADSSLAAAIAAGTSSSAPVAASASAANARVVHCSTRSYLLEISNHFRLATPLLSHHSFLWHHLHASQAWQAFLPSLCEESRAQSRDMHRAPIPEPEPAVNSQRAALERALGFSLGNLGGDSAPANPNAFVLPKGYGEGIELGSVFAFHLGYRDQPAGGAAGAAAAGAGAGGAAGKKKRKKKKNKKKKAGDASAASGDATGEDDDSDEDGAGDGAESDASSASNSASTSAASSPAPSPEKAKQQETNGDASSGKGKGKR